MRKPAPAPAPGTLYTCRCLSACQPRQLWFKTDAPHGNPGCKGLESASFRLLTSLSTNAGLLCMVDMLD